MHLSLFSCFFFLSWRSMFDFSFVALFSTRIFCCFWFHTHLSVDTKSFTLVSCVFSCCFLFLSPLIIVNVQALFCRFKVVRPVVLLFYLHFFLLSFKFNISFAVDCRLYEMLACLFIFICFLSFFIHFISGHGIHLKGTQVWIAIQLLFRVMFHVTETVRNKQSTSELQRFRMTNENCSIKVE